MIKMSLSRNFKKNIDTPDEVKPTKYDQGTGTYYADEELAKEKLQPVVFSEKKEEKIEMGTLEDMLTNFVSKSNELKADSTPEIKYTSVIKTKESKWHS